MFLLLLLFLYALTNNMYVNICYYYVQTRGGGWCFFFVCHFDRNVESRKMFHFISEMNGKNWYTGFLCVSVYMYTYGEGHGKWYFRQKYMREKREVLNPPGCTLTRYSIFIRCFTVIIVGLCAFTLIVNSHLVRAILG